MTRVHSSNRSALYSYCYIVAEFVKMSVNIIVLLPLFFVSTVAGPGQSHNNYKCGQIEQPANCQNHPNIKVFKNNDTYRLTLFLNNQLSENITFNFSCSAICGACETLLTSGKSYQSMTLDAMLNTSLCYTQAVIKLQEKRNVRGKWTCF